MSKWADNDGPCTAALTVTVTVGNAEYIDQQWANSKPVGDNISDKFLFPEYRGPNRILNLVPPCCKLTENKQWLSCVIDLRFWNRDNADRKKNPPDEKWFQHRVYSFNTKCRAGFTPSRAPVQKKMWGPYYINNPLPSPFTDCLHPTRTVLIVGILSRTRAAIVVCIAARVLDKMPTMSTVRVGWRQSVKGEGRGLFI